MDSPSSDHKVDMFWNKVKQALDAVPAHSDDPNPWDATIRDGIDDE